MRRAAWTATVLVLILGGACKRGPDTEDSVRQALVQANIPSVEVVVDDDEHIVHLTGVVPSMSDRGRAEEIATAAVGTTGQVLNELLVAGLNDRNAGDLDGKIRDALDEMLDGDAVLKERDVNFEVHNGMVAIKGEVRTADEKNRVGQIATAAPGVKGVANGLEIKPE
jgi:osmotically-inducible protein OsmY